MKGDSTIRLFTRPGARTAGTLSSLLTRGMFWTRADGAGQPKAFTQSKNRQIPWSFSSDAKRLAYFELNGASGVFRGQIWTVPAEGTGGQLRSGNPEQFLKTTSSDCCPVFSRDGRFLAYVSNESGKDEVYVRAFPPPRPGKVAGGRSQTAGEFPRYGHRGTASCSTGLATRSWL